MKNNKLAEAKCKLFGISTNFAELVENINTAEEAVEAVRRYKQQFIRVTDSVGADDRQMASMAMYFSKVGQCSRCGKLIYREWGICDECIPHEEQVE